ncbi:MAG: BrnT family toxin [Proteobacteria bacterium]|nr:BrnT family toxin [Pseudomonadota bacterium]
MSRKSPTNKYCYLPQICCKIEIGAIEDKVWTAIFTIRDDAVRIISVRRSRAKEKKIYDKKTFSRNNR